ncbi:Sec20-domain-containing protein [Abortiporus biennis]
MAPLPSTIDADVQARIDSLQRKQKDLFDFQIPRLKNCKGPLILQQQYAAEVRDDIEQFAKVVETLGIAVDDQRRERDRNELRHIVEDLQHTLARLRKDSRSALLVSKRAIDANSLSNREELLQSSAMKEKQDLNEKVAEDALMKANNDVTVALHRTIDLMQGELERSVLSSQLLDQSTASLRSASKTHDVLDGLMVTSKHLITALEKSDWLDRLLILAALLFFILVVLFILKQRLVDRSLRIVLFWTRFIPSSSKAKLADAMEKGSASALNGVLTGTSSILLSSVVSTASIATSSLSLSPVKRSIGSESDTTISDILETAVPEPMTTEESSATSTSSLDDAVDSPIVVTEHDEL